MYEKDRDPVAAEDVAKLLTPTSVGRRTGGGTLTSEPVVVVRGKHLSHFDLFDSSAGQLGRVVRVARKEAFEFRDIDDGCVLKLEDVGPSWRSFGLAKWRYEVSEPDKRGAISVRRVRRLNDTVSITEGPMQVGTIRSGAARGSRALRILVRKKSPALVLEDHHGRQVARIYIARKKRAGHFVDLVVEVEDGTPEQLRKVAIAASVIADRELIEFPGSGSPGPPVSPNW